MLSQDKLVRLIFRKGDIYGSLNLREIEMFPIEFCRHLCKKITILIAIDV
jgi:hypothetical protein